LRLTDFANPIERAAVRKFDLAACEEVGVRNQFGQPTLDGVWSGKWICLKQRLVRFAVLETQDNELT
jgi:hypothetical protein